jgi:hypothetical protein
MPATFGEVLKRPMRARKKAETPQSMRRPGRIWWRTFSYW